METLNITREEQALFDAASKDETRYNINGVYFNCDHVIATTGHVLAIRKKNKEENAPENVLIQFKGKMKGRGKSELYENTGKRIVGVWDSSNSGEIVSEDFQFPDTAQVINNYPKEETVKVSLDAHKLLELVKAMGGTKKDSKITLEFADLSPIYVSLADSDTAGIIMPCRSEEEPIKKMKEVMSK